MEETIDQQQEKTLIFQKQTQIKDLIVNDIISDIFVVKSKSSVQDYASATKFRFTLTLADKSGEIDAKYWGSENKEEVDQLQLSLQSGDVVHITAKVQEYHDLKELNINDGGITKLQANQYHSNFFIEESKKDLEEIYQSILETISKIKNIQLKVLCNSFYQDPKFKEALLKAPATKMHHHSFLGGLLEHIDNMLKHSKLICQLNSELNKDLLTSITLLACLGKISSLELSSVIDISQEGHMLGDVFLSVEMLQEKIKDQELDEDLKLKLLNAVISQQGKKTWGAARQPATPEALAFAKIKDLDASISQMISLQEGSDTDSPFFYTKEFGNMFNQ